VSTYGGGVDLTTYVDRLQLSAYGDTLELLTYDDTMATFIASIRDIAAAVRGRRLSLGLSQNELAGRARVSRQWISEFEAGKPTAELGLVLRLLDALGLGITLELDDGDPGARRPSGARSIDLDALLDDYRC
jgi:HTH-type transcriptional regulator/antitoxin HipB